MKKPLSVKFSIGVLLFHIIFTSIVVPVGIIYIFTSGVSFPFFEGVVAIGTTIVLFLIFIPLECFIAFGLFRRKKWGWLLAGVYSVLIGVFLFPPVGTCWGILILVPLLFPSAREFFGITLGKKRDK